MKYFCAILIAISVFVPISLTATTPTAPYVTAELEGLHNLFTGREVDARVIFTLSAGYSFAPDIYPRDFQLWNLPRGLFAEEAERIDDNTVTVEIVGIPSLVQTTNRTIGTSNVINSRNFRRLTFHVPVVRVNMSFYDVTASATPWPQSFTFDLNRYSRDHRDVFVGLTPRGHEFRSLRFGAAILQEDTDYYRHANYDFTLRTEFLERLPLGRWDLTFYMSHGAHPTITMNIIDSSADTPWPTAEIPGPPPAPPVQPPRPDENSIHLSGGLSANLDSLHWDLNRARVSPAMQNGSAELTIRTHVLDHLGWSRPGDSFEMVTPMVRLHIPTDLLCIIFGGRAAIVSRGLPYNQVDLRITLTDRSGDANLIYLFETFHPYGERLTPLVDLRMELINVATGEIFFTAEEFTRPLDMTYVVMSNAGHLRPAGVFFQRLWLEFVPYRNFTPNEITTRSIFAGTHGVIHNRVHFEDVYQVHWGFAQAQTAAYSGLLFPVDQLQPYAYITRAEFAQLVASALQLPRAAANNSGFTDILATSPFFDGVSRLFEAGLLGPYTSGAIFRPTQIITREEMAAILGMAANQARLTQPEETRPLSIAFTDAAQFSQYHLWPVQTAVNHGLMIGYPDNTFRPQAPATRLYALDATIALARLFGLLDE